MHVRCIFWESFMCFQNLNQDGMREGGTIMVQELVGFIYDVMTFMLRPTMLSEYSC